MNRLAEMERHLEALYEVDARGRLLRSATSADGADDEVEAVPRFHLARTALGNVWRFRSSLGVAAVKRLAMLAGKEAALGPTSAAQEPAPPEREEFMRRALEETAPIEKTWAGPAYAFSETRVAIDHPGEVRQLDESDREALHPELAGARLCDASIGVFVGGQIVSLCECVRRGPEGPTEAGVRSADAFARRGCGAAAVAAWALAVRERGGEPFYSTSWQNRSSRALAQRLGLVFIGEDRHWG